MYQGHHKQSECGTSSSHDVHVLQSFWAPPSLLRDLTAVFGLRCCSVSSCPCRSPSRHCDSRSYLFYHTSVFSCCSHQSITPTSIAWQWAPFCHTPGPAARTTRRNCLYNTAAAILLSEPREYHYCTSMVHFKSTTSIPQAYLEYTISIPRSYLESTTSIPLPYLESATSIP